MPDALVRPPTPDPDGAAVLEHVAAVEGSGRLDLGDPIALGLDRLAHPDALGPPLRGTRAAQHRDVAVHDDLVLDEDTVGAVVDRRRLDDRPAAALQHVDVLLPLSLGQRRVDGTGAGDVRHEPVREAGRGSADEREATVHALTLGAPRQTAGAGLRCEEVTAYGGKACGETDLTLTRREATPSMS